MSYQFAITGCGKIAGRHAQQAARLGKLVAVCDVIAQRADELAAQYGARAYYSHDTMLATEKTLDVVSICTPNGLHAAQSIAALQAGVHVLCEKPMCLTTADGAAMIAAAAAAGKKLFVVKSSRYNPLVAELKQLLDSGSLGKTYSFQLNCVWNRPAAYYENSWKGTMELDGGTLFTQFSHYTDVLLWLLGGAKAVTGFRTNAAHTGSIAFEDTGAVAVQLESGAIGTIHYSVNALNKNHEVSLTIVAEKGTVKLGGEYMNELLYQEPVLIHTGSIAQAAAANDYGFYKGSMSNHDKVYENLVKALDGTASAVTDGEGALKTVAFTEKIYQQVKL
jgi:UDP-N-acetyl-2-amino-2-deoxyglucuronate dehydrogenase